MIRNHQFDKVELVQIAHPQKSYEQLEQLTGHAEEILRRLELPLSRRDLVHGGHGVRGGENLRHRSLAPGQNAYREISSCSNFETLPGATDAGTVPQTIKGRPELVHTLNGSGLAVGRTLIAVMENYQRKDGRIDIPAALRPYNGEDRGDRTGALSALVKCAPAER